MNSIRSDSDSYFLIALINEFVFIIRKNNGLANFNDSNSLQ